MALSSLSSAPGILTCQYSYWHHQQSLKPPKVLTFWHVRPSYNSSASSGVSPAVKVFWPESTQVRKTVRDRVCTEMDFIHTTTNFICTEKDNIHTKPSTHNLCEISVFDYPRTGINCTHTPHCMGPYSHSHTSRLKGKGGEKQAKLTCPQVVAPLGKD